MMNTRNIAHAIEDSLVDYLQVIAKNGKRPFTLNHNIGWVKTYPTAWSNFIFYANFDDNNIEAQLSQICDKIKTGELPKDWVVGPKSFPSDLGDYLEKYNIRKQYSMAGMAIDLSKMDKAMTLPNNIHIEVVDTKAKLELWADIVSKALWNNEPFEACLFENQLGNPDYEFYLAFHNNEAVASSMLILTNGVAEINMVSTLKQYQRMGIGSAMTIEPLLYAKKIGYQIGVLQASIPGEPVYRKIGFQEYCRFHVYRYQ